MVLARLATACADGISPTVDGFVVVSTSTSGGDPDLDGYRPDPNNGFPVARRDTLDLVFTVTCTP